MRNVSRSIDIDDAITNKMHNSVVGQVEFPFRDGYAHKPFRDYAHIQNLCP